MADTWITDFRHHLDDDGNLAPQSGPARGIADHHAAIVSAATHFDEYAAVRCRRKPGRKPCSGNLDFMIDLDTDDILWRCPECGDNGEISNWQKTRWDHFYGARAGDSLQTF